jgi:hypothetical protein
MGSKQAPIKPTIGLGFLGPPLERDIADPAVHHEKVDLVTRHGVGKRICSGGGLNHRAYHQQAENKGKNHFPIHCYGILFGHGSAYERQVVVL